MARFDEYPHRDATETYQLSSIDQLRKLADRRGFLLLEVLQFGSLGPALRDAIIDELEIHPPMREPATEARGGAFLSRLRRA